MRSEREPKIATEEFEVTAPRTQRTARVKPSDRETRLLPRVATGVTWTIGSLGGLRIVGIAQTLILARLLNPADFGLYAMVSIATGTANMLTGFGIGEGVIQSRLDVRDTLDSAFCLNLLRGALLYGLVFFVAPWVERLFLTPGLATLIRVAGLSLLLRSANNVGPILFTKELDYRRAVIYSQCLPLATMISSVALAVWYRNVWALVLSQVAAAVVMLPISYWAHPFRPRLRLESRATHHLIRYGSNLFGASPLFYLSNHVDEVFVGRWFGTRSLGMYQLAYNTSALPATYLSEVVMGVLFPVFARIQATPETLRDAYVKTLRHIANLTLPLSAFLFLFAPEFIRVAYGAKWEAAAPLLMAFTLYGALRSVATISMQVFKATGQTRTILHLAALNLGVVAWVVLVGAPGGPFWIAALLSVMSAPAALYGFDLIGRLMSLSIPTVLRACRPAALATGVALAVTLSLRGSLDTISPAVLRMLAGGLVFGVPYLIVLVTLDRNWVGEIRSLLAALELPARLRGQNPS